ncbi:MAG: SUMF1/EgtB/PvdO family nonheme iron enzyme [Candidatus Brocadiales bacterium]|nr:SUMF1/EgtB/PvdO family nonheme iron enzyme [Candidatus Brocadiales bacterium]
MIRQQVENLAKDMHPENLIVVTAREAGYQKNAVFGDDFIRFDVQRLSENQINSLVEKWCSQLYPGQADKKAHELKDSIKSINELRSGRELSPLVSSPLMTTMVISVKWGETELPRERAKLYEAAVKAILQSQYIEEDEARKDLVEWGGPWEDQREWLSFLAYEMHHGGEADAVISEERVREILQKHLPQETIKKFIEAVRNRGGLFEERAELFQFTHLTFQEFLTARYLAKERNEIFNELQKCIQNSWWREVLLLTYGVAKFDYAKFAGDYLKWLSSLVGDNETQLAGLELAGSALLEIERPDADLKKEQAEKLSTYLFNPQLRVAVIQRVGAGATLARLGDPRPEATSLEGMQFFYVPEGSFIMGSNKEDDSEAFERKFPQDELTIPGFYISRFPITNEQFDAFVQAKGYENEGYWTKDGWNWKDQENIHGLRKFDSPFNLPNHPVVGVSWYEALAFTRWLNGVWKDQSILPDDLEVKIPSEAEWEKAARGGMDKPVEPMTVPIKDLSENVPPALENNPNPKRIYPWGNDPDPNLANYDDTGVGTTSAVGCFPAGASPYGCEEMSGNVFEWTRSNYKGYPYIPDDGRENLNSSKGDDRVLRGGCFYYGYWDVRCADRLRHFPDFRYNLVGFRFVLSPF